MRENRTGKDRSWHSDERAKGRKWGRKWVDGRNDDEGERWGIARVKLREGVSRWYSVSRGRKMDRIAWSARE